MNKLQFALRMAWRETRASTGKFIFLVLAIAMGTGALTAVTGFNESVRYTLLKEARTLMAADISVRLPLAATAPDLEYIKTLEADGIVSTRVTETVSMASAPDRTPVLASVKGADLSKYPFYGALILDPANAQLDRTSVAVSDDLLLRLKLQPGGSVRIGGSEYRIAARILSEPDTMTTGFTLGPRILFTREGLADTGIVTPMSRVTERVLLKLPPDRDLDATRSALQTGFGRRARITDYTETNPTLTRALNRATQFLSMVSLIALIVGGLGVGATMQSHLRQKMTNVAFMKCIGGRSADILNVYLVQALLLGLIGSVLGSLVGAFSQSAFAQIVGSYFDVDVTLIWPIAAMLKGMLVGLATTTLFTLPTLLSIREVRPILLLRKEFSEDARPKRDSRSLIAGGVVVAGLWMIAIWIGGSVYYASVFAGSLAGSILIIGVIGAVLLRILKFISSRDAVRKSPMLRHGIANLYRPGAHTVAILASLGIGVMFTLSVYYLQHSLLDEIRVSAPPDAPNVFLINITDRERAGVTEIIQRDPAVTDKRALSPAVTAQLTSVDAIPMEELPVGEGTRRFLNTQFTLTWLKDMPPSTEIVEGQWWTPSPAEHEVSVQEFAAEALGVKVGSRLEWSILGKPLIARVSNIRRTDATRFGANNQFILSPGALDGFPTVYYGAIRVQAAAVGSLQARIFEKYPTVTVVNAADVLDVIQGVVDRTSLAVRFVAGFAIFGGLIVLASSVAGTRYRRMREVAILKTVGATRSTLVKIFSAEFAVIGAAAGVTGSVLGAVLSGVLIGEVLDTSYKFTWLPVVVATLTTMLMTVVAGWLASYGILNRKPLDILRNIEG